MTNEERLVLFDHLASLFPAEEAEKFLQLLEGAGVSKTLEEAEKYRKMKHFLDALGQPTAYLKRGLAQQLNHLRSML